MLVAPCTKDALLSSPPHNFDIVKVADPPPHDTPYRPAPLLLVYRLVKRTVSEIVSDEPPRRDDVD